MLAIIGLPGSGKTTVGQALAERLQLSFIDSDIVLKDKIGCSIREYFEKMGEAKFRDAEEEVIAQLSLNTHGVVSTGGGSILRENNRTLMSRDFFVIYLSATPEELFARLRYDTQRPLLQVSDPMAKLHELYNTRTPLYDSIAHLTIKSGSLTIEEIVEQLTLTLSTIQLPKLEK